MKTLRAICLAGLLVATWAITAHAGSEINGLTFINKSGEPALVKLVGPSRRVVEVPDGQDSRVKIPSGSYVIYVRYGNKGHYRYTKGESFEIRQVAGGYIEAQLTLHGVVNGNYRTEGSSKKEFERM